MALRITEVNLGSDEAESLYTRHVEPPLVAIQPNLPAATRRARELEGHGHDRRLPKGGRRVSYALASLDALDEGAIRATERVVEDLVSEAEITEIHEAYRASEYGDAYWIAFYTEIHLHVVIAVLRWLQRRGELPD